jgi:hypothetical protein
MFYRSRLVFVAAPLLLVAAVATQTPAAVHAPPVDAQSFSFSVTRGSPATALGVHPADILGAGLIVLLPCDALGLLCTDPATDVQDDLAALAYGQDFTPNGLPPLDFSVAAGAQGGAGSAVRMEASCKPAQPQADVFQTALNGANAQDLDGDGAACGGNAGFGLAATELPQSDDVDALDRDPCQAVDLDCDGALDYAVLLTLAPGSPSLAASGATAADVLMATGDFLPTVFAGQSSLGLASGDAIDALCVRENGNGVYDPGDKLLFSLAPGSPTLARLGLSPGDLLRPGPVRLALAAGTLGLQAGDNLDAALCTSDTSFTDLFLPAVSK